MHARIDKHTKDEEGNDILVYEITLFAEDQEDKDFIEDSYHTEAYNSHDLITDKVNIIITLSR